MKLIPKRQNGGSFLSLFADYIPLNNNPQSTQSSQQTKGKSRREDDNEKGKLTEKDLFTLLKDVDGLPNEMRALVSDIQRMYSQQSLYENDIDTSGLANLYAQNIYKLKHANFNKVEYDKAYKEAEKNEGLNEFAISTSGKMIVYDKDKNMTQVSVSEYLNNQEEYSPVTNSNLLWLRAHDPSFVNNNQIFDTIQNGIGINKVEELIRDRMQNLGTNEQTNVGYTSRANGEIRQGIAVLEELSEQGKQLIQQGGMTLDGLYKTKVITKDQQQQALAALKYIYQTLPNNAKAVLQLRSGNGENPAEGAIELIGNMIMSKTSSSHTVESDYQENLNLDGTKKSTGKGSGTLTDEDMNVVQQFLAGYGNKEQFVINPGTNVATAVQPNTMPLVKKDGTPLGVNSTLKEISEGQFGGGVLDWNKVTMGGRKIDTTNFNQVIVSDGYIRSIDFPVDASGNPDIRPITIKAKREFDEKVASLGIDMNNPQSRAQHSQEINQLLEEVGLSAAYDSNGEIVSGNWKRFAVMNGTADNRALNIDPLGGNNQLLNEITDDSKINNLISIIQDKTKIDKLDFDKNDWGLLEGDYDMFLEGTIWIPLNVNYHNAAAGSGQQMSMKLNSELEKLQQLHDRQDQLMRSYKNPGQP